MPITVQMQLQCDSCPNSTSVQATMIDGGWIFQAPGWVETGGKHTADGKYVPHMSCPACQAKLPAPEQILH